VILKKAMGKNWSINVFPNQPLYLAFSPADVQLKEK
jgi:hypothetical protein